MLIAKKDVHGAVISYELQYLGEFIRKSFTSCEQTAILQRAKGKDAQTSHMSEKDVLNYKAPCPLLKDNACSAYPARPMACLS